MVEADYQKKYYLANKEKHLNYYKEKVTCKQCGAEYSRSNASNHKKTKKHLNALIDFESKYNLLLKKYLALKSKLNSKV